MIRLTKAVVRFILFLVLPLFPFGILGYVTDSKFLISNSPILLLMTVICLVVSLYCWVYIPSRNILRLALWSLSK